MLVGCIFSLFPFSFFDQLTLGACATSLSSASNYPSFVLRYRNVVDLPKACVGVAPKGCADVTTKGCANVTIKACYQVQAQATHRCCHYLRCSCRNQFYPPAASWQHGAFRNIGSGASVFDQGGPTHPQPPEYERGRGVAQIPSHLRTPGLDH